MKTKRDLMFWSSVLLVAAAVTFSSLMIWASSRKPLDETTLVLFQILALGLGLAGSFVAGRISARKMALDLLRPAARSAFRRLLFMYRGLQRLGLAIERKREELSEGSMSSGTVAMDKANAILDVFQAMLLAQIATADDAMEEWRDLVPDEVAQIELRGKEKANELETGRSDYDEIP